MINSGTLMATSVDRAGSATGTRKETYTIRAHSMQGSLGYIDEYYGVDLNPSNNPILKDVNTPTTQVYVLVTALSGPGGG